MRIIRDTTPNQYMVLIKFCNQRLADEFFNTYNNVSFNSIEPDICQLIYVAKVEVMKDSEVSVLICQVWVIFCCGFVLKDSFLYSYLFSPIRKILFLQMFNLFITTYNIYIQNYSQEHNL